MTDDDAWMKHRKSQYEGIPITPEDGVIMWREGNRLFIAVDPMRTTMMKWTNPTKWIDEEPRLWPENTSMDTRS